MSYEYTASRVASQVPLMLEWDGMPGRGLPDLPVGHFHSKSSDHRPVTRAKIAYDEAGLYAAFQVEDRYVKAVHIGFQAMVFRDSCVELFVQPKAGDERYFNFEFNCGGSFLLNCNYLTPEGRVKSTPVDRSWLEQIRVSHSLPESVDPEIEEPVTWYLSFYAPFALLEAYVGKLDPLQTHPWRMNAFKCGDRTSHPHWASWAPIGEELNFHRPQYFGTLRFDGPRK